MTWHDNYLVLDNQSVEFKNKIYKVLERETYIFVLLGFDFDPKSHCNIYCIQKDGHILWQIKKNKHNSTKSMSDAYIGLTYRNGCYEAINFYNQTVYFNPYNGKIIG